MTFLLFASVLCITVSTSITDFVCYQGRDCRQLSRCPSLLNEIRRAGSPMPARIRKRLQDLGCGFEADEQLVCCDTSGSADSDYNNDRTQQRPPSDYFVTDRPFVNRPFTQTETDKRGEDNNVLDQIPDVRNHPNLRLLPSECGAIESERIFGGNRTSLFEMPWMVLLSYKSGPGIKLSCGGSLITEWYVLTAAHCVSFLGRTLQLEGVILGEYDIRQDPDCERMDGELVCAPPSRKEAMPSQDTMRLISGSQGKQHALLFLLLATCLTTYHQNVSIDRVIAHPGYSPQTLFDDIALIRLAQPADFSLENMKPLCLPTTPQLQRERLEGSNGIVAGWGTTEDGLQSPVLLSVALPVITNGECQNIFNGSPQIYDRQLCAGGVQDKDSCGGDSGGPLMYPGRSGSAGIRYVQRGIVSYGSKRCGVGGYPGVYTRVAYYMDWILNNIR